MIAKDGFFIFHGSTLLAAESIDELRDLFDSRETPGLAFDPELAWEFVAGKGHVLHFMEQRKPQWFQLRRGIITASEVGMFVASATTQKAKDARQNLIDKKLGELADGDDTEPSYESYWMARGTLLEPQSIEAYEKRTGLKVYQVGFIQHDTLPIGCSPDGEIVDANGCGIEGKAVAGKTQIGRLRDNVLPAEYVCQIHHSLVVTGAPWWDFWSYHPTLPPFHIRTHRNEFTDQFEKGLREICAELKRQKEWIRDLWDRENRKSVA